MNKTMQKTSSKTETPDSTQQPEPTSPPQPGFSWAVPEELGIPPDPLRLRLDFNHQSVEMTLFDGETVTTKIVDAMDVSHALANELSFGSGLLPPGTIWWRNTKSGPVIAVYIEPHIRQVTLQTDIKKQPNRYKVPMPGLIFLIRAGIPPWVFAMKKRPKKETDIVYRAPLANIHANGRSCGGSHKYPARLEDMVDSFFISFFRDTVSIRER